MARLPVYTSQVGIQPAGAPSIPDQGAIGRAISGAGNAIQQIGGGLNDLDTRALEVQHRLAQRQKQENAFDDDSKLSLFKQKRQNDYQTAWQNMPANADGFAASWVKGSEKPNADFLATISPANRNKVEAQLRVFDEDMAGTAAKDQFNARATYETNDINQRYQGYLTTIARNPDERDAVLSDLNSQIDKASSLTAQTKLKMKQDVLNGVSYADFKTRYGTDPDGAKRALGRDPNDKVALPKGTIGPGQADRENAAMSYFVGRGYTREQAAGIVGNLVHESGGLNVKSRNPGDGSDGTDSIGIAQWNSTRASNLKAFAAAQGKDWHDLGVQLAFVDHELNTSYSGVKQKLLAAKSPDEAAGVFVTGYERPQGSEGGAAASHGWSNRRDQSRRLAGGDYKPGETEPGTPAADPRYAALTLDQQDSLIDSAERERKQLDAANAAGLQKQLQSLQNTLQTQLQDGNAGMPEINQARQQGWLSDADTISKFTKIVQDRDKGIEDTRTFFDNLNSGRKSNPFNADDKKIADAGFKALGGDINALDTVYSSSGIMPPAGITALRGGLISKDASTVGTALTIATNALNRDPNAFTAVDGGNEIERQAQTYSHLVNDRGIPTTEAVRQIMEANTPEYKSKIRVNDQDLQEFRKSITSDTIAKQFKTGILSGYGVGSTPAFGSSPTQAAVMMRDYREAAEKHYKETADADLAQKMAKSDMDKIWGVTNVFGTPTLVNFPVEKTYPGVGVDPKGSHNYVMVQASDAIHKQAGQLVAPENLIIAPIPDGSTAQAYYKGQPAPYNVGYMAPDENGYMVPHILPNPMTFDPEQGHSRAMIPVAPAIDAMSASEQRKQQDRQAEQDFQMQRWQTMNPGAASQIVPNRREWPVGPAPKMPPPKPPSNLPTSGNDAFQKTKEEFEQRPNILPGGLGLGM
jgi:hypothetical protein